jgi:hypothetical protein
MIPSEEYNSFFWIAMLQLLQLFVQLCNTIKAVHPFLQGTQQGLAFYSGALTYLLEPDTVPAPSPVSQETGRYIFCRFLRTLRHA